jgi:hypothetical protein
METNSHTDKLFEQMRALPPEIPVENVEKFVLAQAAIGITAVAASKSFSAKGIFTKAFIKFHLNTIFIMTSAITAAVASIFIWHSHQSKTAENNSVKNLQPEYSATTFAAPKILEADSPKVNTVQTVQDGEPVSVTTIQTENGTNIKVVTNGNSQSKVYYNAPNDSSYTYAYTTTSGSTAVAAVPPVAATPQEMAVAAIDMQIAMLDAQKAMLDAQAAVMQVNAQMPDMAVMEIPDVPPVPCTVHNCFNDPLREKLESSLLKDSLISDTLHYTFKINGSYMKVNGEKVDKKVWEKYKELIESNSLNHVDRKFSYAILRDGDDTSINVENYVN